MLDGAIANYTDANNGYDGVFNYYREQTFMGPPNSTSPAGGPGNKYFTCELSEGGVVKIPNQPCPIPDSQYTFLTVFTMIYTLENSTGFFNELADTYGIEESWVDFTTVKTVVDCSAGSGHGSNRGCEPINISQVGYPTDSGNVTVSNPKDIITRYCRTVKKAVKERA